MTNTHEDPRTQGGKRRMRGKRTKSRRALLAAVIAIGVLGAHAGSAAPIVDLSLGSVFSEDFEGGDGGFVASPPPPVPIVSSWAHGTPTSGPGIAASGVNVWATNLAGTYLASECSALLSPPISIPAGSVASASFMAWHHMQMGSTLANDAGQLFVTSDDGASYTLVTPAGGYTSPNLGTTARACLQDAPSGTKGISGPTTSTTPPAPVYTPVTADLSAFAGQTVRFAIAFASDSFTQRAGWYIDDFSVTIDGATTTEDFESGDGGFTLAHIKGTLPRSWSHGTPTTGPASPTSMWATNLHGNYGQQECATLTSPPFTIEAIPAVPNDMIPFLRAQLSWEQFFRTGSSSSAGVIQVGVDGEYTNIVPTTGYGTTNPISSLDACLQDDTQGTGGFTGSLNTAGDPLTEIQADLTSWIGKTITLRWVFASTATATRDLGWYVDNVNVELFLTIGEPELPGPQAPGWTSGGTNSSWAYGVASAGPKGETAWGTNLGGNYNNFECSFVQAPEIPGTALTADPTLTFSHWYEIESISATGSPYDGGFVIASADGGATWTELVPQGGYPREVGTFTGGDVHLCKATYGLAPGGVYGGNKQTFDPATFDLSAFTGADEVTLRFVFSSDNVVSYDGWFIKDVAVAGVPLLPPALPAAPDPDEGTDHPGWSKGGVTSWAYGAATAGPVGETAWGTNLTGNYGPSECGYIETPALPGALVDANPVLAFDHWYEIESLTTSTTWDGGFVLASTDGGATWSELTPNGGYPRAVTSTGNVDACKATYGFGNGGVVGGVYGGDKQQFDPATFGLAGLAGAQDVRIRFVFASDGSVSYDGWFIKNVTVAGLPLTLSTPSSI